MVRIGFAILIALALVSCSSRIELAVTTVPAGATVSVDGEARGVTPAMVSTTPGLHNVKVELPGYHQVLRQITLEKGKPGELHVELNPLEEQTTGNLIIATEPADAALYVDGTYIGQTPTLATALDYTYHDIRIVKEGYKEYLQTKLAYPVQEELYIILEPN